MLSDTEKAVAELRRLEARQLELDADLRAMQDRFLALVDHPAVTRERAKLEQSVPQRAAAVEELATARQSLEDAIANLEAAVARLSVARANAVSFRMQAMADMHEWSSRFPGFRCPDVGTSADPGEAGGRFHTGHVEGRWWLE